MKTIEIQAKAFFELIKNRDVSMWSMFEEMVNSEEEQLVIFLDEEGKEVAHYILPKNVAQVKEDQKIFAQSFKEKLQPGTQS
ncbi:MAG: hypothetical protein EOP54_13045 [Sphingobacteriales bacterium]|nr:MAG: hypothetical protein EOP54_13045 [Sphingobacteriales bacterium]